MNATAPIPIAPTRPTLDVELKARNNCRYKLGGLRCLHAGEVRIIRGTAWLREPGLWLFLDRDPDPIHDTRVTLLDRWPLACCPSKLRIDGLPKGSGCQPKPKRPAAGRDATLADLRAAEGDRVVLRSMAGEPIDLGPVATGAISTTATENPSPPAPRDSARHDGESNAKGAGPGKVQPPSLCGPDVVQPTRVPDITQNAL